MSDQTIDKQIVDQLYWDSRVDASEVGVTVEDGRATLKGTVPSFQAKIAGAEDAYLVRGVKFVDNQLQVHYPTAPTDAHIKKSVETILDWDFSIDTDKITVSVNAGNVKLLGTVDAYWKKIQAEEDAFQANGVIEIKNELGIVLTNTWSDETIAKDIEEALRRNINVEVNDVDVKVGKGNVTLTGEVSDWTARNSAGSSAWYTAGVKSVVNALMIS